MTSGHTTLNVDVLNEADETETGRQVPVQLVYWLDVDKSYGADADGNRQTKVVSIEVLDVYIEHEHLRGLTSWQVERLLRDAGTIMQQRERVSE